MDYLLIRHKVQDFTSWKSAYDRHLPARQRAGLKEVQLLQGSENPNEIVILFEAEDLAKARQFSDSDDLRQAMQRAGVVGEPDLLTLRKA